MAVFSFSVELEERCTSGFVSANSILFNDAIGASGMLNVNGKVVVKFERNAATREEAVESAMQALKNAGLTAKLPVQ